jgi:hypothetical protein
MGGQYWAGSRPMATTRWLGPAADVAHSVGTAVRAWATRRWPDDHVIFNAGLSVACGRPRAR